MVHRMAMQYSLTNVVESFDSNNGRSLLANDIRIFPHQFTAREFHLERVNVDMERMTDAS